MLTAAFMTMLYLKRFNVPLDRDVIFLAEAGEEGGSQFGIQFMVNQHYSEIDSEDCLAEGGGAIRIGGVAEDTAAGAPRKDPPGLRARAPRISRHGSDSPKSYPLL